MYHPQLNLLVLTTALSTLIGTAFHNMGFGALVGLTVGGAVNLFIDLKG